MTAPEDPSLLDGLDPALAAEFLLNERRSFLFSIFLLVFMNGIYTGLVAFTVSLIFSRKERRRSNRVLIPIIILMYIASILYMGVRWWHVGQAFVYDADTPLATLTELYSAPTWADGITGGMAQLIILCGDSVMVWRCWVIWHRSWKASIGPALLLLVGQIFGLMSLYWQSQPEGSIPLQFVRMPSLVNFSFSLATTVISTALIVVRILMVGRLPGVSRYRGVIEIFVESALLWSVMLIIYIPFYVDQGIITGARYYYLKAVLVPISGIAPTLLVARVALGQAREAGSWQTTKTTPSVWFSSAPVDSSSAGSKTRIESVEREKSASNLSALDVRYTTTHQVGDV